MFLPAILVFNYWMNPTGQMITVISSSVIND